MLDDEIHIFPFFSENGNVTNDTPDLDSNTLILRSQVLERRSIDPSVYIYCVDQKHQSRVYYWHPVAQKDDVIQRGIELVKSGLSPNPKTGIIDDLFVVNKRQYSNPKRLKNKFAN